MKRYLSFIIPAVLLFLTSTVYSQSVETVNAAKERLKDRGLLTRIIERYEADPKGYAYLQDLIIAADDLVRASSGAGLANRISKVESEIAKLKEINPNEIGKIDEDEIEFLVRKYIDKLNPSNEGKLNMIGNRIEADSIKIADLDKKIKDLQKPGTVSPATPNRTFLLTIFVVSAIALLSAR